MPKICNEIKEEQPAKETYVYSGTGEGRKFIVWEQGKKLEKVIIFKMK